MRRFVSFVFVVGFLVSMVRTQLPTFPEFKPAELLTQAASTGQALLCSVPAVDGPAYLPAPLPESTPEPTPALLSSTAADLANRLGRGYYNSKGQAVFETGSFVVIAAFDASGRADRVEVRASEPLSSEVLAQLVRAEVGDAPARQVAAGRWVTPSGVRITIADYRTRIGFARPNRPQSLLAAAQ